MKTQVKTPTLAAPLITVASLIAFTGCVKHLHDVRRRLPPTRVGTVPADYRVLANCAAELQAAPASSFGPVDLGNLFY